MKWKITIKLIYLIILFALFTYKWSEKSQLIDSDPKVDPSAIQQAYNKV